MPDVSYTEYPMILNTDSMEWVLVGYLVHILLAVFQATLAGVLIVSGLSNIVFGHKPPLKGALAFFGAGIGFTSGSEKLFGSFQIILGSLLLAPYLFGTPHVVSMITAVAALVFMWLIEQRFIERSRVFQKLFAYSYLFFAALVAGFSAFEGKDNLKFGIETAFKAKKHRDAEIAWQLKSDPHSPKLGQYAPNFSLTSIDGETQYQLTDFLYKGRPLVLFFGANSCPAFSQGTLGINQIHEKYKSRVNFLGVYVKEPHPTDEWWLTPSRFLSKLHEMEESRAAVDIKQPKTFAERLAVAKRTHENLLTPDIPFVVDAADNAVNNQWTGQPTRIYLLDEDGKVLYNPGTGPYSFNPTHLEPVLESYFAEY